MGEIDEVIKRQIRSEPIQIAGQKRKTCSHSISFTVFFRRIELVSTYFYQWASEYGGSIKQEQEGAHHPTKNISHQPGSVFWVMVASCSSLLTLGHSYGLSQLCWAVLNIKKQRKIQQRVAVWYRQTDQWNTRESSERDTNACRSRAESLTRERTLLGKVVKFKSSMLFS